MILAEKIMELRKKSGWSQEELADKLEVSRQSISKWESAQSVPDMNRILLLSKVFGVSTDYLLKDEINEEPRRGESLPEDAEAPLRKVSLAEAQAFLRYRALAAKRIPLGVLMCILSPIVLILLAAGQESGILTLSEQQAVGLGLAVLFLLVGGAVALFVLSALSGKPFEYLNKEAFETEYGVSGFARERQTAENGAFVSQLTAGIVLCVLSAIPVFTSMFLFNDESSTSDFYYAVAVAVTLCFVACGVWLILRATIRHGAYSILLEEGDYTRSKKQETQRNETVSAVYWCLITAGYLAYSFITGEWQRSWIVWPVAGVLYACVLALAGMIRNRKK